MTGARVALGPRQSARLDLEIRDGRIVGLHQPGTSPPVPDAAILRLSGRLLLPGLVNAHEHLEFSLFPRLGRGPYPSARAWSEEIYRPDESPIREHLEVPKEDRLRWGGLRNLLAGVTTVCHHNPYDPGVFESGFPIRVVKEFGWAHSLAFSDDIASRFQQTPPEWPFILHLGEGTDDESGQEIFRLAEMGALDRRTVLVHAVALDEPGLALVEQSQASIIWCPSSNLFLLGRTIDDRLWERGIPTALATDSSLTAEGDLLDEIGVAACTSGLSQRKPNGKRAAGRAQRPAPTVAGKRAAGRAQRPAPTPKESPRHSTSSLFNESLYEGVTATAAQILCLCNGEGTLKEAGVADFMAVRDTGDRPCDVLTELGSKDIELVVVDGRVKLLAAPSRDLVPEPAVSCLHRLVIDDVAVLVDADVPRLTASASAALGKDIRLAGKRILT